MRALTAFSILLLLAACGQADGPVPDAASQSPDETPTIGEEPPAEIALSESDEIVIEGDTGVLATPGEVVVVDHVLRNSAPTARSVGLRFDADIDLAVEVSTRSARLKRDEVVGVQSTVTIPDDAEVGDVLSYDIVAVNVDDVTERSTTTVNVLVVDAAGRRPSVGDDAGATGTNEQVFVFALGDDTDPDGDLDAASLRVIAGGWLADEITGNGNGTISYVPFANVEGVDVVVYEVCDGENRCDTGLITITIGAPEPD